MNAPTGIIRRAASQPGPAQGNGPPARVLHVFLPCSSSAWLRLSRARRDHEAEQIQQTSTSPSTDSKAIRLSWGSCEALRTACTRARANFPSGSLGASGTRPAARCSAWRVGSTGKGCCGGCEGGCPANHSSHAWLRANQPDVSNAGLPLAHVSYPKGEYSPGDPLPVRRLPYHGTVGK
jgi:hypothetical protein